MSGRLRAVVSATALSIALVAPARAQGVEVTYLGNMGVLLEGGGARILVDALFRDSMDPYARHSRDAQEQLETGGKPYDGVLLALATHFHLDHWDAGAVTRFLRTHPSALFGSTEQGVAMMPYDVRERARNLWPATGATASLEVAGVKVTAFPLEHGKTQNLGYRIELAGRTLVHLGDADPSPENCRRVLASGSADVALLPFWWLTSETGASCVKTAWKPRSVVALHIGTTDLESVPRAEAALPGVWPALKTSEARKF